MRTRRILNGLLVLGVSAALVGACGGDGDGSGVGTGDGDLLTGDGDGALGAGGAQSCAQDDECSGSAVCHPSAGVCVSTAGACPDGECPSGYACDEESSKCIPGLAGTPCHATDDCQDGSNCDAGVCGCIGFQQEQETLRGPLDIYFIFDRTRSMGDDCEYDHGSSPPVSSKACFATYAMSDYLIDVPPTGDTRLAFQFMSYENSCDGGPYETPLIPLNQLPLSTDHAMVQAISDEDFAGGSGTQIEGALNGIAYFTANNQTPGREMIGVLMTDGDPTDHCDQDIGRLAQIISDHRQQTGLRTFIIGMEGATEQNLEQLAIAGGAEPHDDFCAGVTPPCHYWNVGTGQGDALQSALSAIVGQASPLPCEYPLSQIQPRNGQELDLSTLNVRLSQPEPEGTSIIFNVSGEDACPADAEAWHFDSAANPTEIVLCPDTCDLVSNADAGARMTIVGGCEETMTIR